MPEAARARSVYLFSDSPFVGGAERALLMLARSLDREQWRPAVLVEDRPTADAFEQLAADEGLPTLRVPPAPLGLGGARRVPELVRTLREGRPAVFHAHMSWPLAAKYPLAAAAVARVPAVVGTVQLVPTFDPDRSTLLQMRALSAAVDRWIAVSHDVAQQLVERFHWPPAKVQVIHNAVELDRFNPAANGFAAPWAPDGRPVVLTCARLDVQKGHQVLLEAAARLPDARFAIAGDGPERAALEAQAAALGIGDRVVFLGDRDDVPALLRACDAFALPSLYEGSSLAVLEAMAAGRAVVSSAIGGTDELIVNGESGVLVPPGDAPSLADALRRVLADHALRTRLGTRARVRAASAFSAAAATRAVTQVYEEALVGARQRSREAGAGR